MSEAQDGPKAPERWPVVYVVDLVVPTLEEKNWPLEDRLILCKRFPKEATVPVETYIPVSAFLPFLSDEVEVRVETALEELAKEFEQRTANLEDIYAADDDVRGRAEAYKEAAHLVREKVAQLSPKGASDA